MIFKKLIAPKARLNPETIRARRIALGMTMVDAGIKAGFLSNPAQAWQPYEQGRVKKPRIKNQHALAAALECTPAELFQAVPAAIATDAELQAAYDAGHACGYKVGYMAGLAATVPPPAPAQYE